MTAEAGGEDSKRKGGRGWKMEKEKTGKYQEKRKGQSY